MKIALIGYGKMGKAIEAIAHQRGHETPFIADTSNWNSQELDQCDVAIEFSQPEFAVENINKCFDANTPVVVGTTGWYNHFEEIKSICTNRNQALFTATNFSVGVNLFFEINKRLAQLMNNQEDYDVSLTETHHVHKLDSPSGTAITLAEGIIENLDRKTSWAENNKKDKHQLQIQSMRENEVPGTHSITYNSKIDQIQITHEAKNREGFALGAVLAAQWLLNKKGVFSMKDMLEL